MSADTKRAISELSDDPFAALLGAGRGAERDAAERRLFSCECEPTPEGLAYRGLAAIARYAPHSISRELTGFRDEAFETVASDLLANLLHALAHARGEDAAFEAAGSALADMLCERRECEEPVEPELSAEALGTTLEDFAEHVRRRAGVS